MSHHARILVSLSAYASEGGLDGRYQPATCYSPVIALGRHRGPGAAEGLWTDYESVLDLASEMGLTGVCLEVSWARLEPRRGRRDESALARYAQVVTYAKRCGLVVSVAAIDAAWPAWLGQEAWLMPWVIPVAVEHVTWLASSLEPDGWCVFASPDTLIRGFLSEWAGPPWRRHARDDAHRVARNLETIDRAVRRASRATFATSVNVELDEVTTARTWDVDEVHVRSLVRGTGPLATARGLVARRGSEWVATGDVSPVLTRV